MRPRLRGPALAAAAVIVMLLTACTSGTGEPGGGKSGRAAAASSTPVRPLSPSTSATVPTESALDCGSSIGRSPQAAPLQVVLGVVALPASAGYPALQTSLSGDGSGPLRLFAKTGLLIRPGTTFELVVPAQFTSRLSIGWGKPGTPSGRVLIRNCASTSGGWLAYAGGYWIDHPACVPITVRAGGKQQHVHVGVGTACPGQRPPQGPSQD